MKAECLFPVSIFDHFHKRSSRLLFNLKQKNCAFAADSSNCVNLHVRYSMQYSNAPD